MNDTDPDILVRLIAAEALDLPQQVCRVKACRRLRCCLAVEPVNGEFQCIRNMTPKQRAVFDELEPILDFALDNQSRWLLHAPQMPDHQLHLYPAIRDSLIEHTNARGRRILRRLAKKADVSLLARAPFLRLSSRT